MMESTTMAAEQQDPRLQQVRIHSNVTAVGTEIRKRSRLPSESLRYARTPREILWPLLPTLK